MGIRCEWKTEPGARPAGRLNGCLAAMLLYLALWGGLCGMAGLSASGVAPLALGGAFALFATFFFRRGKAALRFAAFAAAAAVLLLTRLDALDGAKLLLNRLFAASEARQAYAYDKFPVPGTAGVAEMRAALLPAGLLTGLFCGLSARFRLRLAPALLFALYAGAAAFLGVSPDAGWYVLAALALTLIFTEAPTGSFQAAALRRGAALLPLAAVCVAVFLLFPGEDARLSAWDERARDVLALQTVAYADEAREQTPETPDPAETAQTGREERAERAGLLNAFGWPELPPLVPVIALFALLLFVPSIYSDRLKKRRARNRAGLDAADNGESIRAAFLYAVRWLRFGGFSSENRPYGESAGQVEALFSPELREAYETILPLWQEAAYSEHAMDAAQREAMLEFMEQARRSARERLGARGRFLADYVEAL